MPGKFDTFGLVGHEPIHYVIGYGRLPFELAAIIAMQHLTVLDHPSIEFLGMRGRDVREIVVVKIQAYLLQQSYAAEHFRAFQCVFEKCRLEEDIDAERFEPGDIDHQTDDQQNDDAKRYPQPLEKLFHPRHPLLKGLESLRMRSPSCQPNETNRP